MPVSPCIFILFKSNAGRRSRQYDREKDFSLEAFFSKDLRLLKTLDPEQGALQLS